eukprot:6182831-Pleurochrysis_carterae.AAC.1
MPSPLRPLPASTSHASALHLTRTYCRILASCRCCGCYARSHARMRTRWSMHEPREACVTAGCESLSERLHAHLPVHLRMRVFCKGARVRSYAPTNKMCVRMHIHAFVSVQRVHAFVHARGHACA